MEAAGQTQGEQEASAQQAAPERHPTPTSQREASSGKGAARAPALAPAPAPAPASGGGSHGRSRALDIRLCQRKKERNADLPFPELLSVLFQNDITESNHEIYMGGVGAGGGGGSCLLTASHAGKPVCGFQLNVLSPLCELRANTGDVSST